MHTLLEFSAGAMPVEKKEIMTEEKPLSRFVKDEMMRKEKLLEEILDQTKMVKKKLEKFEKQTENESKGSLTKKEINEIRENISLNKETMQKQMVEVQFLKKEMSETKSSIKHIETKLKQVEKSSLKKGVEIARLEEELKASKTDIAALKALEAEFLAMRNDHIDITDENEKIKRELKDWQELLETETQQQRRCFRCKKAARRVFREHSSE